MVKSSDLAGGRRIVRRHVDRRAAARLTVAVSLTAPVERGGAGDRVVLKRSRCLNFSLS